MGRSTVVDIKPPLGGVSDNNAFMDQEPWTTRTALNARGLDPVTGRRRVTKRSGWKKHVDPDATMNGSNKVGDLGGITKDEDLLTYADDDSSASSGPSNVFAKLLPGPSSTVADADCVDMRMDDFGDLYVAQRSTGVHKYNQDGELLVEIPIPEAESSGAIQVAAIAVDEFGNVAIAVGGAGTATVSDCRLHLFENRIDGTYRLAWSIDSGHAFNEVGFHQGSVYTLESDLIAGSSGITSYFKVYRDYNLLQAPSEDLDVRVDLTAATATDCFGTRLAIRDDGVVYITGCDDGTGVTTIQTFLVKINPNGDTPTTVIWDIINDTGPTDNVSGLGYGVALGPKNSDGEYSVYTYGPRGVNATDSGEARRIVDTGTAFSTAATNAWVANLTDPLASPHTVKFMRLATDADGHLYLCTPQTSSAGAGDIVSVLKATDGTALNGFNEALADAINGGTSVAVTQDAKPKGSSSEEVEFVFYGTRGSVTGSTSFFKQRMLKVTQGTGPMRTLVKLGVSGGNVVKFTATAFSDPAGGTGVAALDSAASYVQSSNLGLFRYFADGKQYKRYSVDDDAVSDWLSETSGGIPPRCKIIETWRGRLMLGRDPEDPQLWHSSAVGLANNWDNFPPVASLTQAVSGINAKAGRVPDIVNAIIPWDDDLCLFGGDNSIWRLTGDPLAGGQFDQISLETGIAFGRAWTLDPIGGRLFFFGSRGGVYMMQRGSLPVRISRDRIERRLQDVDLTTTYIRMVWNYRDEGLHIFQLPFGAGGTILDHWFWDAKQDGWWPDRYGTTGSTEVQPTAVFLFDGDAQGDRVIMAGGEDGRIREWNELTKSDEGASADLPIQFEVVYGPIVEGNTGHEYSFTHIEAVLASDRQGAGYRCYISDQADSLGLPVARGSFQPGRNNGEGVGFRGSNAFISVSNTRVGQSCSIEDLQVRVARRGRVRKR